MLRTELFSLINEYHDVFTSDQCKVGDTTWVKFKIELSPKAQLLSRGFVLPPPPLSKRKFEISATDLLMIQ